MIFVTNGRAIRSTMRTYGTPLVTKIIWSQVDLRLTASGGTPHGLAEVSGNK